MDDGASPIGVRRQVRGSDDGGRYEVVLRRWRLGNGLLEGVLDQIFDVRWGTIKLFVVSCC